MIRTLDSESNYPSSNLGGTLMASNAVYVIRTWSRGQDIGFWIQQPKFKSRWDLNFSFHIFPISHNDISRFKRYHYYMPWWQAPKLTLGHPQSGIGFRQTSCLLIQDLTIRTDLQQLIFNGRVVIQCIITICMVFISYTAFGQLECYPRHQVHRVSCLEVEAGTH